MTKLNDSYDAPTYEPKIVRLDADITQTERKIFDLLLNVINYYKTGTILRVAGGWVRDKLLGEDSKDIDFAINNMSGEKFAQLVNKYLEEHGLEARGVGVIEANPDQSKHLETATTFIEGLPIDFAGLRTETYADDSRIPTVELGTPLEDAQRRDLTINALFYNVNTERVEDYLGQGLQDLENKIIRTPLEPEQTFRDDPLRVLRAVRFAVRWFGFTIDPAIAEASKTPEVQHALKEKVSRERIGIEFFKMMDSIQPYQALKCLKEMGLRDIVLELPEGITGWDLDQNNPYHEMNLWDHTVKVVETLYMNLGGWPPEVHIALMMAAVFHDTGKLDPEVRGEKERGGKMTTTFYDHEYHSEQITRQMMQSLKYSNDLIDMTCGLIRPAGRAEGLVRNIIDGDKPSRRALGRFVRAAAEHLGDWWDAAIELGKADMCSKKIGEPEYQYFPYFNLLKDMIREKDMQRVHTMKPLLNGHEIMKHSGIKPGPAIGKYHQEMIDWQLDNPNATKEDAKVWLVEQIGE
jgi:tRNA nucleotidyltransferase/poly(A) polymerase